MNKIIKYNLKLIFSYNVIAAFLLVCMSPVFFQLSNMDFISLAKMGELYLSLTGIFLFISLGNLEGNKYTWEFVYIQQVSYTVICLGRLLAMMLMNAILIFLPLTYVYLRSESIKFFDGYLGFIASAWFLGLLGLLVAEIFRDFKVAYIITLGYYFIATSTMNPLKRIQVFRNVHGNMDIKYGVYLSCMVMIIVYLVLVKMKCKRGIE